MSHEVAPSPVRSTRTVFAIAGIVPMLIAGLSACAPSDDIRQQGAGSGSQDANGGDQDTQDDGTESDPSSGSLDSAALLERGMAGDLAVKCDFAADDLTGTIYFHGSRQQRFDTTNANGVPTHILMFEGQAHAWNDVDAEGARYPKSEEVSWLGADDAQKVKARSSNCVPHEDLSVFALPQGIDFVDMADILEG